MYYTDEGIANAILEVLTENTDAEIALIKRYAKNWFIRGRYSEVISLARGIKFAARIFSIHNYEEPPIVITDKLLDAINKIGFQSHGGAILIAEKITFFFLVGVYGSIDYEVTKRYSDELGGWYIDSVSISVGVQKNSFHSFDFTDRNFAITVS